MHAYRRIAVPLFGSKLDVPALNAAFRLALAHDAEVDAFAVQMSSVELAMMAGPGFDISGFSIQVAYEAVAKASAEALAAADAAFKQAQGASSAKAGYRVVQGAQAETVERETRLCDLAVFCVPKDGAMSSVPGEAMLAALLAGSRPVLILPEEQPALSARPRIALAYDGSAAAAHTVQAAIPLLGKASEIVALSAGERETATATLEALRTYLALHGIAVRTEAVPETQGSTSDALLRAAVAHRAEVLVLGGYGHSRVREFVLGGVTRQLLHHGAPLALLMAH
jgi:nucleotide-binding universal stress UspA family protein